MVIRQPTSVRAPIVQLFQLMTVLPMLIVFVLAQHHFVEGPSHSGLK
ncbi:hypothetical protein ACFXAZ_05195 [Streptomyces sp. NPDC059477]